MTHGCRMGAASITYNLVSRSTPEMYISSDAHQAKCNQQKDRHHEPAANANLASEKDGRFYTARPATTPSSVPHPQPCLIICGEFNFLARTGCETSHLVPHFPSASREITILKTTKLAKV